MSDLQPHLQATLSGTYTLERKLGGGGMSRVFVADEIRLGISHLSKFVELWKNADPELPPTVADAKRRLTRLQAGTKS